MEYFKPRLDDSRFVLEAFGYAEVQATEAYQDYDLDTVMALQEEASKLLMKEWMPLNQRGDQVPLQFDPATGDVTLPEGLDKAYRTYCDAGLVGLTQPIEYGGGGMPHMAAAYLAEVTTVANKSLSMCPGLSQSFMNALSHHGTEAQKAAYLPKLTSGKWTGTMCLTEPQCGTDLGLVSTKAIPDGEGYRLTGTKIWISFGEHNLADNILHLVLARLPGAPAGIKGISCFIVPKFLDDGTRNGVMCTGLEHKMGIHASPTCVISLEDAYGTLIGEANHGMRTMFVMMNSARLEVGIEGIALGDAAYQAAVVFARDRRQMRALDPKKRDPDAPADTILVHPDIRRMLLNIRATTEGMRGLAVYVSKQADISHAHADKPRRQQASDLLALLTPVLKSYCTERGFLNINDAMQVCGGAGYTADWPIEQLMRDERIAPIYEGTNHIQALDLVGRKLPQAGGRLMRTFAAEVTALIRSSKADERLAEFVNPLKAASKTLTQLTMQLAAKGMKDPEEAGAAASNYLNVFGLTALAFVWVVMARAAIEQTTRFERAKIKTARYFFSNVLPEIDSLVAIIGAGKAQMMAFDDDEF